MNKKHIDNYLLQYIELIHDFSKLNFWAVQLRCSFACRTHCFTEFLIFFGSNVIRF